MRVAAIQLNSQNNLDANLEVIDIAISRASAMGAGLVVLPENACYMGRQSDIAPRFDELAKIMSGFAKAHHLHLLAGTLPCPYRADGIAVADNKLRQVSLLFDNFGNQLGRYDKTHLFAAKLDDSVGVYDEGETFEAGDAAVAIETEIDLERVTLGLMICYDLRFPCLAQTLRNKGADILVAPSAFTEATGKIHWQILNQARALDSQCMVLGAAQGGTHCTKNSARKTWGHAMITNANGHIMAMTNTQETAGGFEIVMTDFDKRAQDNTRRNLPIFDSMRAFE